MKKMTTGMILGGLIGASSIVLMNIDKRDIRKAQKKGRNILDKAENLMDDLRGMM